MTKQEEKEIEEPQGFECNNCSGLGRLGYERFRPLPYQGGPRWGSKRIRCHVCKGTGRVQDDVKEE